MSPRFLSDKQQEDGNVFGLKTNAESRIIAGSAGQMVIVWDENANAAQTTFTDELGNSGTMVNFGRGRFGRNPVLIRIRNLHASEPLRIAEDLRDINGKPQCTSTIFSDVLACGTATDDGNGAGVEWQKNRPSCIAIQATNAWRAVVLIRYAE